VKLNLDQGFSIKNFILLFYKNKHLIIYILIGIFSISCELFFKNILFLYLGEEYLSYYAPFIFGVLICFFLNFLFNFNVPNYYFFRSLSYFFIISLASYLFQYFISSFNFLNDLSFEFKRYLISGCFFIFGYFLHINFSFKNIKKIGIAIYPNSETNLDLIYEKIKTLPDFIHIDLVDETIKKNANLIDYNKIKQIRNLWPNHEIQFHIMSRHPSLLLDKTTMEKSIVFIHKDIDENINSVIKKIKSIKAVPGLVIHSVKDNFSIENYINSVNEYLILSIKKPGFSGQKFLENSKEILKKLNKHPLRSKFKLSVDGGVTVSLIPYINSDRAISSSEILNSPSPQIQIIKLKTLSRYQR